MSTHINLIMAAQDIVPAVVRHRRFTQAVGELMVLDAPALRREVERAIGRELVWDEWLDVRDRWCKRYRVHGLEVVRGHDKELPAVASLARVRGYQYLLLEEIA